MNIFLKRGMKGRDEKNVLRRETPELAGRKEDRERTKTGKSWGNRKMWNPEKKRGKTKERQVNIVKPIPEPAAAKKSKKPNGGSGKERSTNVGGGIERSIEW